MGSYKYSAFWGEQISFTAEFDNLFLCIIIELVKMLIMEGIHCEKWRTLIR